jgi:predicted transcriptional regulator
MQIWVAISMKTTIEIADDLFERAQQLARKESTTFRSLAEQGLRLVLKQQQAKARARKWKPITQGGGLNPEFKDWNWEKIRDLIYEGR